MKCKRKMSMITFDYLPMKAIAVTFLLSFFFCECFGQRSEWSIVDRKGSMQKIIAVPGKDAAYIYREVNRWLVATFKNPEDVVKGRLEKEYIKGQACHAKLLTLGAVGSGDFQYGFTIDIKDEKVKVTLTNGILLYSYYYDRESSNGVFPIELYLETDSKRKKPQDAENVVASVNKFSHSLVDSLEMYLNGKHDDTKEEW